ncbi:MAG: PAS domain S-box protein, partial [Gemmatimonadaceae bacterium]|nr:PAS domain S-box protein [Acetobacteraceae bacterium]
MTFDTEAGGRRYQTIFDSAVGIAIIGMDAAGRVTDWNPGAERILGWSSAEMRGAVTDRIFTPEDRAAGRPGAEVRHTQQAGPASDERWALRRDGSRFWACAELMPLVAAGGSTLGVVKILRDRTEHKHAADAQRIDAEFLRSVLASSGDCIKVLDLEARLIFMTEAGRRIMEVSDFGAIRGHRWPDFWDGDAKADAEAAVAKAQAGGRGHFQGPANTMSGTPRFWDVQVTPILDRDGRPERLLAISRDITAAKQAEARLRDSEDHYRHAVDLAPQTVWTAGIDGQLDHIGPRWHEWTGVSGLGGSWADALHPDDREPTQEAWSHSVATGAPHDTEHRVRMRSGAYRWMRSRAFPRRDAGRIARWYGTTEDVHAARSAEHALLESEARFRNMADHAPVMMWTTDPNGECTYVNRRWHEFTGKSGEEALRLGWARVTHPDDQAAAKGAFLDAHAAEKPYRVEFRLRRADGAYRWVIDAASPRFADDGAFLGHVGSLIDIDDRREAERALEQLNDSLEDRVEQRTRERDRLWHLCEDLLVTADYAGRLLRVSPSWTRLLGHSEATLLTQPYATLVHPDDFDRVMPALLAMRASGRPASFEDRLRAADGSWRWIAWTLSPEPGGERLSGVGRDITAVKAREAELEQSQEALRQSQKMEAVGQLTGGLAHDFNNLLAGISGSLELLQRRLAQGRVNDLERYILAAQGASKRAAALTHRLLAFTRRQTLAPKPTDMNRLVAGMEELIRRTVGPPVAVGSWRLTGCGPPWSIRTSSRTRCSTCAS